MKPKYYVYQPVWVFDALKGMVIHDNYQGNYLVILGNNPNNKILVSENQLKARSRSEKDKR